MTFHDVRLPEEIERGALGGPRFKTHVLELESGFEQRNRVWANVRGEWDIGYGLMHMDDDGVFQTYVHLIRDFFYARNGRAFGFRFKDWSDYKIGDPANPLVDNQDIALGDDVTTVFQVFKRYSNGGFIHDRTIRKLVAGTYTVLRDGSALTEGPDYTIDINTASITLAVALASTGGTGPLGEEVLSVATEYDVPVRFDDDHLRINIRTANAASVPQIPLVELRLAT